MRKLSFIGVLMAAGCFFVGTGCTDKGSAEADTIADSLGIDSLPVDSLETLIEETPVPKTADQLFDDFIFNYAANRKLQRERTDFPLLVDNRGVKSRMDKGQWRTERFFMKQGYYTLIFNSRKQMALLNDTSVASVTVEKLSYEKNEAKRWVFNRVDGLWRMQKMTFSSLSHHEDADFLEFYQRFATDSVFQQHSLAELVSVSCPDPEDDFSRMTGEVIPEQWPAFAPWMPSGELYNIHYGKAAYKPSSERIFVIRGIANGLETELTFRHNNGAWQLVKMEN